MTVKIASRLDVLVAQRAIMHARLTAGEKAVGWTILAHFNEDSGQCDPGLTRVAKLAGVKVRTVTLAADKVEGLGLFTRDRYGGKSHRNRYVWNWDRCRDFVRESERAARPDRGVKATRELVPKGTSELVPYGTTNVELVKRDSDLRRRGLPDLDGSKGQAEGRGLQGQLYLTHGLRGGKATSHNSAAQAALQRRQAKEIAALPTVEQREAAWLPLRAAAPAPSESLAVEGAATAWMGTRTKILVGDRGLISPAIQRRNQNVEPPTPLQTPGAFGGRTDRGIRSQNLEIEGKTPMPPKRRIPFQGRAKQEAGMLDDFLSAPIVGFLGPASAAETTKKTDHPQDEPEAGAADDAEGELR